MAIFLALLAFVLVGFPAGSFAAAQSAPATPARAAASLRITGTAPLAVRGRGFAPGERVRVTFRSGKRLSRRTITTSSGNFSVRSKIVVDRCVGAFVIATGNRGSHAQAALPLPVGVACPVQ